MHILVTEFLLSKPGKGWDSERLLEEVLPFVVKWLDGQGYLLQQYLVEKGVRRLLISSHWEQRASRVTGQSHCCDATASLRMAPSRKDSWRLLKHLAEANRSTTMCLSLHDHISDGMSSIPTGKELYHWLSKPSQSPLLCVMKHSKGISALQEGRAGKHAKTNHKGRASLLKKD